MKWLIPEEYLEFLPSIKGRLGSARYAALNAANKEEGLNPEVYVGESRIVNNLPKDLREQLPVTE